MVPAVPRRFDRRLIESLVAYLLIFPPVLIIFGLFFFPAARSFMRTMMDADGGISVQRYSEFFADPVSISSLWFTFEITAWSTAGLLLISVPLAFYLRFTTGRLASWIQAITMIPLFVPGLMTSYALIRFIRPRGMFETLLYAISPAFADSYNSPYLHALGIIIGLVWESIPFTVLLLIAGLRSVDDRLIEAARDVGAGWIQILLRIVVPIAWPSVLIALCLNVIGFIGAYTIPYLLGPAAPYTIGVHMQRTFGDYGRPIEAETQAVVVFIICALIGTIYVATISRRRRYERN